MNEIMTAVVEGSVVLSADIGLVFLKLTRITLCDFYVVYFSRLRFSKPAALLMNKLRTPIQCCNALIKIGKFTAR